MFGEGIVIAAAKTIEQRQFKRFVARHSCRLANFDFRLNFKRPKRKT